MGAQAERLALGEGGDPALARLGLGLGSNPNPDPVSLTLTHDTNPNLNPNPNPDPNPNPNPNPNPHLVRRRELLGHHEAILALLLDPQAPLAPTLGQLAPVRAYRASG